MPDVECEQILEELRHATTEQAVSERRNHKLGLDKVTFGITGVIALAFVVWGFVGPQHARFSQFVRPPAEVLQFLADSVRLKARRHVGHNPAGGAMVLALIAAIAGICVTGYMMETLAYRDAKWLEELHEVLANGTLALIFLHVAGVLLASFEHKENLVTAMFTGRKRA